MSPRTTDGRSAATTAALLAGPIVMTAGMAATPWESENEITAYQAALAASPDQTQIAAVLLFFGYALMGLAFLSVLRRAGGAPRALRIPAATLAFCGATMLPGLVVVDFYDLALIQSLPAEQAAAVGERAGDYGLQPVMQVPAVAGLLLGGILVMLCAWRSGLVGGWAPALVAAGLVASFAVFSGVTMVAGASCSVVAYGGIALRLRSARIPSSPPAARPATA
jgi:hypothetical protein